MAEQQPRKKRTRALPPIQRKSIVVKMQLKSSAVTQRVQGISDRLKTMTARIAGLYVLTTSNAEVRTRLETWFSAEIAEVDRRRQLLSTMHQMELKELGGQPAKFDIVTPDSYAIEIEVEHPIFWRVITAITEIDASAAELENMWLSGEIDDQTTFRARNIATNAITHFINVEEYEKIMASLTGQQKSEQAEDTDVSDSQEDQVEEKMVVNA